MQLLVDSFFLFEQSGVLGQLVVETGNVPRDFIEHRQIPIVLDRGLQRFGLALGLRGLFDIALATAVIALATLIQTNPRLIHRLQHQPRHLTDLVGLFDELRTDVKLDHSPLTGIGDLLALIVQRITTRIEPLLIAIDDQIDEMEDSILLEPSLDLQQHLVALRHRIIRLRRHLVPQHEALSLFRNRRLAWLTDASRQSLMEEHSQMHQYLGDLDSMRERALLMQDEIAQLQNRKLNETMKIVAVFTAYLMPMNAITSLLGTNIEGIPGQAGTETPFGFFFEVAGLLLVLLVSYFIFKRLKWFD